MNNPRTSRKHLPPVVQRYVVPVILSLVLLAIIVVVVVIALSIAGLTPGA